MGILSGGLNERLCSGLFGKGVYLAENPEKADQYAAPDRRYMATGLRDLHQILYREGSGTRHPNEDVFYMFVVRAASGIVARTKDGETDLDKPSSRLFTRKRSASSSAFLALSHLCVFIPCSWNLV